MSKSLQQFSLSFVQFLISLKLLFQAIDSYTFVLYNIYFQLLLQQSILLFNTREQQSVSIVRMGTTLGKKDWIRCVSSEKRTFIRQMNQGCLNEVKLKDTGVQRTLMHWNILRSGSSHPRANLYCSFFPFLFFFDPIGKIELPT